MSMNSQQTTTRATREDLQEIHGLLCMSFLDYLKNTPPAKLRASMIEVIRSFLKDNHITKNLNSAKDVSQSLSELADMAVPFLPDFSGSDSLN